jgi:hypothetical protein
MVYTFFSVNIETLFPYWMENSKFDWKLFEIHWGNLKRNNLIHLVANLEEIQIKNN